MIFLFSGNYWINLILLKNSLTRWKIKIKRKIKVKIAFRKNEEMMRRSMDLKNIRDRTSTKTKIDRAGQEDR